MKRTVPLVLASLLLVAIFIVPTAYAHICQHFNFYDDGSLFYCYDCGYEESYGSGCSNGAHDWYIIYDYGTWEPIAGWCSNCGIDW